MQHTDRCGACTNWKWISCNWWFNSQCRHGKYQKKKNGNWFGIRGGNCGNMPRIRWLWPSGSGTTERDTRTLWWGEGGFSANSELITIASWCQLTQMGSFRMHSVCFEMSLEEAPFLSPEWDYRGDSISKTHLFVWTDFYLYLAGYQLLSFMGLQSIGFTRFYWPCLLPGIVYVIRIRVMGTPLIREKIRQVLVHWSLFDTQIWSVFQVCLPTF